MKIAFCLFITFCIFYIIVNDISKSTNDLNPNNSVMEFWSPNKYTIKPPNPAPSINGYHYKGCYNDNSERAIKNYIGNGNINDCVNLALSNGYDTVGIQYYGQCWAGNNGTDGNNYSQFGVQTNTASCNVNSAGGWTNVVYKKPPPPIPYNGKVDGNSVWYIPGSSSQYYADLASTNLIQTEQKKYLYRLPNTVGYLPAESTGPIPPT